MKAHLLFRHWLVTAMGTLAMSAPAPGVTIVEYAKQNPLLIQTVRPSEGVNLGKDNQVNNLKKGAKVLVLSHKGLTSVEGISTLKVMDEGKEVPLASVPELQLFMNNNEIERVPEEFAGLDNVTFIYLNSNKVRVIPAAVTKMKSLLGMYFTENRLTEIPTELFGMKQLRKFQISHNHVKEIPAAFGNLVNLIHLNLAENEIASLPDSMANLTQLRVCDLSGNKLTKLPETFGQVQILYQLRVRENPLTGLPARFAAMPGTIDITGSKIRVEDLSPELRAKLSTEKPKVKPKVIVRPIK